MAGLSEPVSLCVQREGVLAAQGLRGTRQSVNLGGPVPGNLSVVTGGSCRSCAQGCREPWAELGSVGGLAQPQRSQDTISGPRRWVPGSSPLRVLFMGTPAQPLPPAPQGRRLTSQQAQAGLGCRRGCAETPAGLLPALPTPGAV